ncbi:hypothetical protein N9N28_16300 [Rubripirellula amarantea]|nr:hypothetical protein [Rubripirellula amarantea]
MPGELNWWIGVVFAVGATLFALGSVISLAPQLARSLSLDSSHINAIFFAGSIPFTTAAYLQLFQAANAEELPDAPPNPNRLRVVFGWRPDNLGWLSSLLQFIGTVLFNFNTFDAMMPTLDWLQQDLLIWMPDMAGSILFLASGYLAFVETCHAYWGWQPESIAWWIVFANLLGCIAFMVSAVCAVVFPFPISSEYLVVSVLFTLLGAIGFLVGSLLMLPEAALKPESGC